MTDFTDDRFKKLAGLLLEQADDSSGAMRVWRIRGKKSRSRYDAGFSFGRSEQEALENFWDLHFDVGAPYKLGGGTPVSTREDFLQGMKAIEEDSNKWFKEKVMYHINRLKWPLKIAQELGLATSVSDLMED